MSHELVIPEEVCEHLEDIHKGFIFASLGLELSEQNELAMSALNYIA